MDRNSQNRGQNNERSNQCNPNHLSDGPGRQHAYQGAKDRPDINNHGNQLNPNNNRFQNKNNIQSTFYMKNK